MMVTLGEYALAGAMLTSMAVVFAAIAYLRTGNEGLMRGVRGGLVLIAGMLGVSSWGLLQALLQDNFTLAYVIKHSEKALAPAYKATAFWAGQEGSLLFWALVLAVMGVVLAIRLRRKNDAESAITLGVMGLVTGFFTCVMIFAGNPFDPAAVPASNGQGLNPMLQNLAMVAHPPMLFLGYAGFTAPFALMAGALLSGKKDGAWLREARGWMVYSWVVLTVGIVLGAQWAYMELGWGGYWAWDPVENASLLPWLTGTALLHSAILQARRGMFKQWTAWLTAASFFLCVFGTYLTRSGIIQSVHSFGESPIGTFFLVFLAVIALFSVTVLLVRTSLLRSEHGIEDLVSRESFFLLANVLLTIMTAVTLIGTVFPVISGWFIKDPVTVKPGFYNMTVLPMALLLAGVMSMGPIVGHGAGAGGRVKVKLAAMGLIGLAAAGIVAILGYWSVWAIGSAAVVAAVATGVILDVAVSVKTQPGSVVRVFTARSRHWGAQMAHLGLAAMVAGIVGSSVYGQNENIEMKKGATSTMGPYALTYRGLEQQRRANHTAIVATVDVRDAKGQAFQLKPERRFYDRGTDEGQSSAEVALRCGLGSDVYMTLAGWEDNGSSVTITTILNPLVSWIWIGGGLLTLGGLVCLVPTGRPARTLPETPAPIPERQLPVGKTARERRRARQPETLTGRR